MKILLVCVFVLLTGCDKNVVYHSPTSYLTPTYNVQTTINVKVDPKKQLETEEEEVERIMKEMKKHQ
jgi:hypothetical protein